MLTIENAIDLGFVNYKEGWDLQRELVEERATNRIPDTLVLCEHEPVYTLGRSIKEAATQHLPFPSYHIERGGKATYHGPGQLVLYAIVKLPGPNVVRFIRELEIFLINLLESFNLHGEQKDKETGVWIANKKIASIGIAVKRWVTYHGAALNVNPNLSHFQAIAPCGYSPDVMTSLSNELKTDISVKEVKEKLFQRNPHWNVEPRVKSPIKI